MTYLLFIGLGYFLKALSTKYGIPINSSISSKNDFEAAKAKLIEAGIWDYFIFPSINWNPKGENGRNIIADCQLRAPNILFIDDNVSNRKEVEHYNEGINTLSEAFVNKLLSMPELKGKDDSSLFYGNLCSPP